MCSHLFVSLFVLHTVVMVLIPAQRRGSLSGDILFWQLFVARDNSFCSSRFVSGLHCGPAEAGEQLFDAPQGLGELANGSGMLSEVYGGEPLPQTKQMTEVVMNRILQASLEMTVYF